MDKRALVVVHKTKINIILLIDYCWRFHTN